MMECGSLETVSLLPHSNPYVRTFLVTVTTSAT